jgi:hypothetical protein
MQAVLDYRSVLRHTPDRTRLSVTLRKLRPYGTGLYARKTIESGETIALYLMKVYRMSRRSTPYSFSIYTKTGNESRSLLGDLFDGSVPPPKNGVPYWAFFANEPGPHDEPNAMIDDKKAYNYRHRGVLRVGDTVEYALKATRRILPGEQIFWCYGSYYIRDYPTSC